MGPQDPRYLAHEYFNANWSPSYHLDVAQELADAKLGYAGSAELLSNFDPFIVKPEIAQLVAETGERALAETIRDFARNQVFRRDVFTRGAPRASAPELAALLARERFALARPRDACILKLTVPVGEVTLQEEAYAPVLDALARGPQQEAFLRVEDAGLAEGLAQALQPALALGAEQVRDRHLEQLLPRDMRPALAEQVP